MKTYKVTVSEDGTICWYDKDGQLHREDGPAIEYANGAKYWYFNGLLHREDGPAIEYAPREFMNSRVVRKRWFIHGVEMNVMEFTTHIASKKQSCSGKIVEIDGKKYVLKEIE